MLATVEFFLCYTSSFFNPNGNALKKHLCKKVKFLTFFENLLFSACIGDQPPKENIQPLPIQNFWTSSSMQNMASNLMKAKMELSKSVEFLCPILIAWNTTDM
jgi:hypothetical protein